MAENSGKSVPDDRQRTEKQIADLVPYVSGSAVDAVRDALLRIVVENREHSEILDLLLPKLEQMPSKRSEALDWLDDQLARLNDDDVISFMERLKRVGGLELKLEPETGASQPDDDPPTVEPERRRAQPSRSRLWMMPATILVVALASFGASRILPNPIDVDALREEFTREIRAELQDVHDEIDRLRTTSEWLTVVQKLILDPDVTDRAKKLERLKLKTEQLEEMRRKLNDEIETQEGPEAQP